MCVLFACLNLTNYRAKQIIRTGRYVLNICRQSNWVTQPHKDIELSFFFVWGWKNLDAKSPEIDFWLTAETDGQNVNKQQTRGLARACATCASPEVGQREKGEIQKWREINPGEPLSSPGLDDLPMRCGKLFSFESFFHASTARCPWNYSADSFIVSAPASNAFMTFRHTIVPSDLNLLF